MRKCFHVIGLLFLLPAISWSIPITVLVDPEVSRVATGQVFAVDLIADITEPVLGFGLDVDFDASVLTQTIAPIIGPAWVPTFAPDGDGLAGLAFPAVLGEDILLATLQFRALEQAAPKASELVPSVTPGDLMEGFPLAFPAPPGSFAEVEFVNGTVSVPEPNVVMLVAIGLIGLSYFKRK